MIINKKLYFWFGLALVILVSIFTWSVVYEFRKNDKQIIQDLKYQNTIAEARETIAKKQRDSARMERMKLAFQLQVLDSKVQNQNDVIDAIRSKYNQDLQNLNNLQDEKDYIPNASSDDKHSYLSEYEYKPY